MKKALFYLLMFIVFQLLGGYIVNGLWSLLHISAGQTIQIISASCLSSILIMAFFLLTRAAEVSPNWLRTRPWAVLFWSSLAALGAIIPSDWLQSLLPKLPNVVEEEFDMILQNRWGYLAIGLLAPLCEELAMRGAILRARHLGPFLCPHPSQPHTDAPCLPHRSAAGLDVLPHGQHPARCSPPLGQQHGGLHPLQPLSRPRDGHRQVLWQPACRYGSCLLLAVHPAASHLPAASAHEES